MAVWSEELQCSINDVAYSFDNRLGKPPRLPGHVLSMMPIEAWSAPPRSCAVALASPPPSLPQAR